MTIEYELKFFGYWHCGSGLSSGADLDLLVIKDQQGMPYVPGKTIKGLLREAVEDINQMRPCVDEVLLLKTFGEPSKRDDRDGDKNEKGECVFQNAELDEDLRNAVAYNKLSRHFYHSIASTAIGDNGVAKENSLRRMEVTIPCTLTGKILNVPEGIGLLMMDGLSFIKRLGQNRNRGLGRCSFNAINRDEIEKNREKKPKMTPENKTTIKELIFEVILKTDIVLNQKAATEGNQQSLDFIPGNNFLGIVAKSYGEFSDSLTVFHHKKVRFGDAHPVNNGERALRVPAFFYHAKMKEDSRILVHHRIPKEKNEEIHKFEPKQYRNGFYYMQNLPQEGISLHKIEAKVYKSFAIKSAYDRKERRSKEGQMFGYESLRKGSEWRFSVFVDQDVDQEIIDSIKDKLSGPHSIGRSRTAQYGLIQIEHIEDKDFSFARMGENNNEVLVYADSRLIFLDEYGLPTFQPKAKDLDFENGKIDWENSQLRFFQYAPWNGQRKTRDTDRCGIEKGSVFCIKKVDITKPLEYTGNNFAGYYQNEGFGKVIIDPEFLATKVSSQIGESKYFLNEEEDNYGDKGEKYPVSSTDSVFLFLEKKQKQEDTMSNIYEIVNEFKKKNKPAFIEDSFASQWGTIRKMAMYGGTSGQILQYTSKGVAKDKWDDNGRREILRIFLENTCAELDSEVKKSAIINLASEMAKIYRRK